MRLPRPISGAEYERRLNRLVEKFQSEHRGHPEHLSPDSLIRRIYEIVRDAGRISFPALGERLGMYRSNEATSQTMLLHSRLRYLIEYGWVEKDGYGEGRTRGKHVYAVQMYKVGPGGGGKHAQVRMAAFLRKVDALDAKRAHGVCMAGLVNTAPTALMWTDDTIARNKEIIGRHLAGEEQAPIARDYGISRERVRQIVHAGVYHQTVRGVDVGAKEALRGRRRRPEWSRLPRLIPMPADILNAHARYGRGFVAELVRRTSIGRFTLVDWFKRRHIPRSQVEAVRNAIADMMPPYDAPATWEDAL